MAAVCEMVEIGGGEILDFGQDKVRVVRPCFAYQV